MLASVKHDSTAHFHVLFLKRLIAQKVYTACTKTSYKIVPLTNLNKYVHYDNSGAWDSVMAKALRY